VGLGEKMKAQQQALRAENQPAEQKAYLPRFIGNFCTVYFYGSILFFVVLMFLRPFSAPVSPELGKPSILFGLPLWLGIAFAIACLVMVVILSYCGHLIRLAHRRIPVYEITDNSIINRIDFPMSSVITSKENIKSTKIEKIGIHSVIVITLKDKAVFYKSLTAQQRFWSYLNDMSTGTPIVIWQLFSNVPLATLQAEIEKNKN
jgi:hypothetical protein